MRYEEIGFESLHAIVRYPNGYQQGKKYPVIILLHGAGGRGNDLEVTRQNPFFVITDQMADFEFISVAPQCCANTWFDLFEQLSRFAHAVSAAEFTDPERVYLMGPSMGGYGTWQLAMSLPELFAAIVPICGGGMYWNAGRLANVPVWAFHGALDQIVLLEESQKMVDAVNHCGGNAKLTVYPQNTHDAWCDTYSNSQVFAWLLSHKNQNAKQLVDEYHGSKLYG